jgi:hypothetical protein
VDNICDGGYHFPEPQDNTLLKKNMTNLWKIAPGRQAKYWNECHEKGCIAINWLNRTNLRGMSKDDILQALRETEDGSTGSANSIWQFINDIQQSHVVVANEGKSHVVGVGIVKSDYLPPGSPKNPFRGQEYNCQTRIVDWVIDRPIGLETDVFAISTVTTLRPQQCEQIKQAYLNNDLNLKDKLDLLFPSGQANPLPQDDATLSDESKMNTLLRHLKLPPSIRVRTICWRH